MKNLLKVIVVVTPLFFIGCGSSNLIESDIKGGEIVVDFSASQMKKMLIEEGYVTDDVTVFGYRAYKIPYSTTDEEGNEVDVSGLFVIPTSSSTIFEEKGLSMVSDSHGTIFKNSDAPTVHGVNYGTPNGAPILLTSIGAFATLQPDYIGFGNSYKHYHPYMLKNSLVNATVDFIRQVKIFAKDNNIKLNQQLFLTGYSEGGYATMATLKKVEEEIDDLSVSMAIPMASSSYSLDKMAHIVLAKEELIVPAFITNMVYSYSKAYDKEPSSIMNENYASKLPTLFDGIKGIYEVNAELTRVTKGEEGLFKDSAIANLESNWFMKAMVENSIEEWRSNTKIRLINCEGDQVAIFSEANRTVESMRGMGTEDIEIISVENRLGLSEKLGHMECAEPSYRMATEIFANIRQTTIGY